MQKLLIKTLINTIALYLVSFIFPAIAINTPLAAVLAGFVLSLLSITIRPVLIVLSLPLSLLSFGLFILVINTWMLQLTDVMVKGLYIPGFWIALMASLVIMILNYLLKESTRVHI